MSRRLKSTYRPREKVCAQGYPRAVVPMAQPPDMQLEEEKIPTKREDIKPGEEKVDEGASGVQGPALETYQQEVAQPKTAYECGAGPNIKGKEPPSLEPIEMPEAGGRATTNLKEDKL
ncbi:X antigen family member 3-like [Hippopotamus amphibius kiboko]|uniref:X antigen family member 3-like n=1 Tax=Hippopotamus amphibius kiboko TaxID=575201 RepID=UPI00259AB755|nr:X antigen family member 3-like [Hippopotamus amphibius kiboko]